MSQSPNSHKRTFRNARFMMVATTPFPKRRDAQKHLTDAGLKLAYRAPNDHGDREYWSNPAGDRFGDHSATITPLKVEGKISFFVAEFDPEPETNGPQPSLKSQQKKKKPFQSRPALNRKRA